MSCSAIWTATAGARSSWPPTTSTTASSRRTASPPPTSSAEYGTTRCSRLASSPRSRSPTWTATVRSRCWAEVAPRTSRRRACSSMRTTRRPAHRSGGRSCQTARDRSHSLVVADTDGDGAVEVAGLEAGGNVYILDGATQSVEAVIQAEGMGSHRARHRQRRGSSPGRRIRSHERPPLRRNQLRRDRRRGPRPGRARRLDRPPRRWALGRLGRDPARLRSSVLGGVETFTSRSYGPGTGGRVALVPGKALVFTTGAYGIHGFSSRPPRSAITRRGGGSCSRPSPPPCPRAGAG